jgi:hypothetical protein
MLHLRTTLAALLFPALLAGGFAACSASSALIVSDDGGADGTAPDTGTTGDDSGTIVDEDAGVTTDGSKPGDSGTKDSGDAKPPTDGAVIDAAKDCGAAPTLHPSPSAGVFCPFQANDASINCPTTPGEHCCIYPKAANKPATCNTLIQGCDTEIDAGGSDFECDEPADCVGGQVCCMDGKALKDPACYYFGSLVRQTKCRTTCATGELTVCSAQAQCTTGTCTPMDTKGKELGVCLP